MKKLLILVMGMVLLGCNNVEISRENIQDLDLRNVQTDKLEAVGGIGDLCGIKIEMPCGSGLECKLTENKDTGICIASIANKNLKCDDQQAPVCGLKNNNKNAYLNECEAKRHGAVILNEGMCKKDELVVNNCNAKVIGFEGCGKIMKGVEFVNGVCQQKQVQGCDIERPFVNIEDCVNTCIKDEKSREISINPIIEIPENINNLDETAIVNTQELLTTCPQEYIINNMPEVLDDNNSLEKKSRPNGYYILDGKRVEVSQFSPDFLDSCKDIKEMIVQ